MTFKRLLGLAATGLAVEPDRAAVTLNDAGDVAQAKAVAFRIVNVPVGNAEEFIEDLLLEFGGDADAAVTDV